MNHKLTSSSPRSNFHGVDFFFVVSLVCSLVACGGGGSGSSGRSVSPVTLTKGGDQQHTFAGGNLMLPIVVLAQDANGSPISSLQIAFSAPAGVTVFPSQVTTGPEGHARAIVNLPDRPFSQFTITATSSKGGTAQFTEYTGPRLLQTFGDASSANGAVLANGTIVAQGWGAGAVFTSGGNLQQYLGSITKKIGLPDFISGGWGKSGTVSPDQKVYLYNSYHNAMYVLDSQTNVQRFIDLGANSRLPPVEFACQFAIAPNGTIFCDGNPVKVFDQNGFLTGVIDVGSPTAMTMHWGIVASNRSNLVVLLPDTVGFGSYMAEYDVKGSLLHTTAIQGTGRGLARDSAGNYAVLECCNPSIIEFFDENYNLLHTTTLPANGNYAPDQFFLDDAWNSYMDLGGVIDKFDSSGNLLWHGPKANWVDPVAASMVIDPATGDAYINSTGAFSGFCRITVYSGGVANREFYSPLPVCSAIAMDQNSHIYTAGGSSVQVLDTNGGVLKTLTFPQISHGASIAIATDGMKFVLDGALGSVHEIDASDNYVGSFAVRLPSGSSIRQGEVVAGYDGSILVGISVGAPDGSSTPDTYVKKLTRAGTETWSVGSNEISLPLQNLAVDTTGRVYLVRSKRLEILDPNGRQMSQVDLGLGGFGQPTPGAATSVGDTIYFVAPDSRVYVISPN